MTTPSRDNSVTRRPIRIGVRGIVTLALMFAAGLAMLWSSNIFNSGPTSTSALAGDSGKNSGNLDRSAIETIVRDYLLKNPELMLEVQTALEVKLEKEQADKIRSAIKSNAKDIYRHPDAPVGGNADGDITVVEFFDYNCGYCKRGFADIAKLIENDPKVRVVLKEYPILSADSEKAAKVALAAKMQGKYWEVHQAMLTSRGRVTEATALAAAEKAGLDMDKLKTDMKSDAVARELTRVKDLAKTMGINGTPHFLVGEKSIGGAPQDLYEQLSANVRQLRSDGCSFC
jgi:protein-disulfide isomerase